MIILWSPLRGCTYWLPAKSPAVIRINGSTLKRLNPCWRMYMASCLSRWQLELNCTPPCLKAGNLHPKNDSNNVCKCSLRNKANIGLRHCWDLHCGTWHIASGAAFVLVQHVTTTSYSSDGVNRWDKLLYVFRRWNKFPEVTPPSSTKIKCGNIFCFISVLLGSDLLLQSLFQILHVHSLLPPWNWSTPTSHSGTSLSILMRGPFTYGATVHCSFILMNWDTYTNSGLKGKPEPHCSVLNHLFLPPALAKLRFSKHQSTILISEMFYLLFMAGDRNSEPEPESVYFIYWRYHLHFL